VCRKSLWLPLSPLVAILSFTLHSGKSPGKCDIIDYETLFVFLKEFINLINISLPNDNFQYGFVFLLRDIWK